MNNLTPLQQQILDIVRQRGKTQPITNKQITELVGMRPRVSGKEGADLRSVVNALRAKGWPICASTDGYFYAYNPGELTVYIAQLEGRIAQQQEAADGLKKGYSRVGPGDPQNFKTAQSSASIPKKEYVITVTDGVKRCSCPGFTFRHTCKHVSPPALFEVPDQKGGGDPQ